VQNAMNIGVGISLWFKCYTKNGTLVKLAENKFIEAQNAEAITDYIKSQVQKAIEDYDLALKQNVVYGQSGRTIIWKLQNNKDKYDNGLSDTNDLLEGWCRTVEF
jgi:hypothetical protein